MARLRVILSAAVTWLVTLAAVLVIVIDELGSVAGIPAGVIKALGSLLTIVGVAVAIIRRVSPVLPAARGILDNGAPRTRLEHIGTEALAIANRRHHERRDEARRAAGTPCNCGRVYLASAASSTSGTAGIKHQAPTVGPCHHIDEHGRPVPASPAVSPVAGAPDTAFGEQYPGEFA